ncbi:bifunctional DNA primase/polymerase [Pseudonocardia petroleophila]|uniref:Bifunctional DNA primase/polymerase n=1 Tax=Pseudonocardia petroleophila TaxID=37331 RepID=A0A7G7MC98_9PSEU|nr:bifunctional DNA primase/polymerase [Pseudonocardia petroleophila]QNG50409.1 bifunctional DNA primase/polymerase [Pseudonocardia petroleophila]
MNDVPHHPSAAPTPAPGRLGAAAARAARKGWRVFPAVPRGKAPAIADWQNAATTDLDQITAWWRAMPWNVAVSAGRSGLLVIDLDVRRSAAAAPRGASTRDGYAMLRRLAAAAGEPPPTDTYTVATPGGLHLYFRQPDGVQLRNTQSVLGANVDSRGLGGYVIAAGSVRAVGIYRVVRSRPVAELPNWVIAALTPAPTPAPPTRGHPSMTPLLNGRAEAYLRAVVDGECAAVAAATVGHRHRTLLRAARRLGHWVGGSALSATAARLALTDAAKSYVGVEGYTAAQVARDIRDGLAYGAGSPRIFADVENRT